MKNIVFFLLLILGTNFNLFGQNIQFDAYTNWVPQFNNYSELMSGQTKNDQINVSVRIYNQMQPITKWKITARLVDDFKYNNYSIPAEFGLLKFARENVQGNGSSLSIAGPSGFLPLSKYQEQTIISSETVSLQNGFVRTFVFDFQMKGGNHLLTIPNGEYKSAYIINLYKIENGTEILLKSISNANMFAGAHINHNGNHGDQSILLENGSNFFHFKFNNVNDLITGKTIRKNGALRIKTYNGHELIVKAANQEMRSNVSDHTLPVSIIQLDLALNQYSGGNSSEASLLKIKTPIQLQSWDQVIATFPQWSREIVFDLSLTIPGNLPEFNGAKGVYETFIYFVIVPR